MRQTRATLVIKVSCTRFVYESLSNKRSKFIWSILNKSIFLICEKRMNGSYHNRKKTRKMIFPSLFIKAEIIVFLRQRGSVSTCSMKASVFRLLNFEKIQGLKIHPSEICFTIERRPIPTKNSRLKRQKRMQEKWTTTRFVFSINFFCHFEGDFDF